MRKQRVAPVTSSDPPSLMDVTRRRGGERIVTLSWSRCDPPNYVEVNPPRAPLLHRRAGRRSRRRWSGRLREASVPRDKDMTPTNDPTPPADKRAIDYASPPRPEPSRAAWVIVAVITLMACA